MSVKVLGVGGVPSSGVAAVVVHVAGVGATAGSYLQAFGTGYPKRSSSTLDLDKGATVSNEAVVPVGPGGAISVYNEQGNLNVIIDMQGWIAAPALTVTPPLASALKAGPLASADGEQALTILHNANRYAMTTWWNDVYPSLVGAPMRSQVSPDDVPALSRRAATVNTGDNTRRLCMEAFSLAISLSTGAYNPATSGNVSAGTATSRTVEIISKVVAAHLVNKPSGWGASTESTFYAAYIGTAAWLLWQDLPAQVRAEVARVVYFEADWGMDYPMLYYANAAGAVISPGNTGADGDSWMPMSAQLATVMMPGNAHAPLWRNAVVKEGIVSWARPSDLQSSTMVNGASVASWIGNAGSNVAANGALINHNRIAPDYSTLIYQNMEDILVSSLAGQPAPRGVTTLVGPVYASFTTAQFASPPWDSPGGTVYVPGREAVYWPQGCDWGEGQYLPFALVDAETAASGLGTSSNATYENLHAEGELALQAKNADGSSYNASTSPTYVYVGREEHVSQLAAMLYLTMFVRDHELASLTDASYWLAP